MSTNLIFLIISFIVTMTLELCIEVADDRKKRTLFGWFLVGSIFAVSIFAYDNGQEDAYKSIAKGDKNPYTMKVIKNTITTSDTIIVK